MMPIPKKRRGSTPRFPSEQPMSEHLEQTSPHPATERLPESTPKSAAQPGKTPLQPHMSLFFAVSLLQYIAANFAHPITPTLIHDLALPGYMFGAAFAAMSFTNFLFSPFWGKMREFVSIRTLIALGCFGYGFGQFLFGISTAQWSILVARCIAGFFVASIGVNSLIYITETSDREHSGKNLAIFVIIQALGAAGGYLLGGAVGFYSIRGTFIMQTLTLFLCGVLYFVLTDESKMVRISKKRLSRKEFIREVNPMKSFFDCKAFMTPSLAALFVVITLTGIGSNAFDQSFNYFLKAQFNLTPIYNGILKAVTGVLTLLFVSTVCMRMMKRKDITLPTVAVLAASSLSIFALFLISERNLFLLTALVFFSFNAVQTPLLQDSVTRGTSPEHRNILMGFYNAVRSLGMICGALFAGFLYDFGSMIPFALAAICFAFAAAGLYVRSKIRNS